MRSHHLTCPSHWSEVPKPLQQQIYHFWRHHRKLEHAKAVREALTLLSAPIRADGVVIEEDSLQPQLMDPEAATSEYGDV